MYTSSNFYIVGVNVLNVNLLLLHQISITGTTSAGVEDILAWIFYHKVVGVTNFFLFVEGKAASPTVSKLLDSIPVSYLIN